MARHGKAVSAERDPVNPPAKTQLAPMGEPTHRTGEENGWKVAEFRIGKDWHRLGQRFSSSITTAEVDGFAWAAREGFLLSNRSDLSRDDGGGGGKENSQGSGATNAVPTHSRGSEGGG